MAGDVRKVADEFMQLRTDGRLLRGEMNRVAKELGKDSEEYRLFKKRLDETQEAEVRARLELKQLGDELRDHGITLDRVVKDHGDLDKALRDSEKYTYHLQRRMELTDEVLQDYYLSLVAEAQAADRADAASRELADTTDRLGRATDRAEDEARQLSFAFMNAKDDARRLNQELDDTDDELGDIDREAQSVEDAFRELGEKADFTRREVDDLNDELRESNSILDDPKGLFRAGMVTSAGAMLVDEITDKFRELFTWINESRKAWETFDGRVRELETLTGNEAWERGLRTQLLNINLELGRLSEETLPAAYQALSAGLAPEAVFQALSDANKLARTTRADLEDTLLTIQRINVAYQGTIGDTGRIADFLFRMVKTGIVTMDELNESLNQINSVAAEVLLPFEDIAGAIEVMSRQGDSMQEIATLMSNMLMQIQIPTTPLGKTFFEAADIGFREFIAQGGTLVEALTMIEQHADAAGVGLLEMIGGDSPFYRDIQAARGVLELTGIHLNDFATAAQKAAGSTGELSEAWKEVEGSSEILRAQADAAIEVLQIYVGELLSPLSQWWYNFKLELANLATETIQRNIQNREIQALAEEQAIVYAHMWVKSMDARSGYMTQGAGNFIETNVEGYAAAIRRLLDSVQIKPEDVDSWRKVEPFVASFVNKFNLIDDTTPLTLARAREEMIRLMAFLGMAEIPGIDIPINWAAMPPLPQQGLYTPPTFIPSQAGFNIPVQMAVDSFSMNRRIEALTAAGINIPFNIDTTSVEDAEPVLRRLEVMWQGQVRRSDEAADALKKYNHHQAELRAAVVLSQRAIDEYNTAYQIQIQTLASAELAAGESSFNLETALWNQLQQVAMAPEAYMAAAMALTDYDKTAVMAALRHAMLQRAIEELIPIIAEGGLTWDQAYEALTEYQDTLEEAEEPVELSIFIDDFLEGVDTARSELDSIHDKNVRMTITRTVIDENLQQQFADELEQLGIPGVPSDQDQPLHWGGWITDRNLRHTLLPGERVLGHTEIANMGGPASVDAMAGANYGPNAGPNIFINDAYQAHIIWEIMRDHEWRS